MANYLYGINAIHEALQQHRPVSTLWVLRGDTKPRVQVILQLALAAGVAVKRVQRADLDHLVGKVAHQGVIAQVTIAEKSASVSGLLQNTPVGQRFFLVLDGVTDPHNFGALIRSAAAAGCQAVIVAKDRSCPLTAVVEKTAAGAVAHISICRVTNLVRALDELKDAGVWVYGLVGEEGRCLYEVNLSGDVALVAGSEGKGLRPLVRKGCDMLVTIPMPGAAESLNVSVASGVALFEVVRSRVGAKRMAIEKRIV